MYLHRLQIVINCRQHIIVYQIIFQLSQRVNLVIILHKYSWFQKDIYKNEFQHIIMNYPHFMLGIINLKNFQQLKLNLQPQDISICYFQIHNLNKFNHQHILLHQQCLLLDNYELQSLFQLNQHNLYLILYINYYLCNMLKHILQQSPNRL